MIIVSKYGVKTSILLEKRAKQQSLLYFLFFYCVIYAILRQNDERKSFICWEFAGSLLGISAFLPEASQQFPEASQLNSP